MDVASFLANANIPELFKNTDQVFARNNRQFGLIV